MDQMILRWNPTIFFSFEGEDVGLIWDTKAVSNSDQERVGGVSEVKVSVMFDEFQRGLCCQLCGMKKNHFPAQPNQHLSVDAKLFMSHNCYWLFRIENLQQISNSL